MKFFGQSGGTTVVEPYATGDIALLDTGSHDGFLPCDGNTISNIALPSLASKLQPAPETMTVSGTSTTFPTINPNRLNNIVNVGYGSFLYANASANSVWLTTNFGTTWTRLDSSPSAPARGLHKMDNGDFLIFHADSSYSTCPILWDPWTNSGAILPNIGMTSLSVRVPQNYIRVSATTTTYSYGGISTDWLTGTLGATCPSPAFSNPSSDGKIAIWGNITASWWNVYIFDHIGALSATVAVSASTPIYAVQMYNDGTKFTIYANNGWFKTYSVAGSLLSSGNIPGFVWIPTNSVKTFKDLSMNESILVSSAGSIALLKEPGDATGCVLGRVPENVNNALAVCVEPTEDSMICACYGGNSFSIYIGRYPEYSQVPNITTAEAGKTWYIKT